MAAWAWLPKAEYDVISLAPADTAMWTADATALIRTIHDLDRRLGHVILQVPNYLLAHPAPTPPTQPRSTYCVGVCYGHLLVLGCECEPKVPF